jgi:hypothetical protein
MGMAWTSETLAPECASAGKAVRHDAGEDEHHGDESGQVSDVLLRAEADVVVMGCR